MFLDPARLIPIDMSSKRPLERWKPYQESPVPQEVWEQWAREYPKAGRGLITGELTGVVVLDFDEKTDAARELICEWPETYVVETPGGYHAYFKHPGGKIKNAVRLKSFDLPIDVRADGGYVIAAGSARPDKARYEVWSDFPLAELPAKLSSQLVSSQSTEPDFSFTPEDASVGEGGRNDRLTREAGTLAKNSVPISKALTLMRAFNEANCVPPLGYDEVEAVVKSVYRLEIDKRRDAAPPAEGIFAKRHNGQRKQTKGLPEGYEPTEGDRDAVYRLAPNADKVFEDFMASNPGWVLKDWLPEREVGIVAAPSQCYKSWTVYDLAVSLALGCDPFGTVRQRDPQTVVLFQMEDNPGGVSARIETILRKHGLTLSTGYGLGGKTVGEYIRIVDNAEMQFRYKQGDPAWLEDVQVMKMVFNPRLMVFDPLGAVVSHEGHFIEGRDFLQDLRLVNDQLTGILVVHHSNKQLEDEISFDISRMSGSQQVSSTAQTKWTVQLIKPKVVGIKVHTKEGQGDQFYRVQFGIHKRNDDGPSDWDYSSECTEVEDESALTREFYEYRKTTRKKGGSMEDGPSEFELELSDEPTDRESRKKIEAYLERGNLKRTTWSKVMLAAGVTHIDETKTKNRKKVVEWIQGATHPIMGVKMAVVDRKNQVKTSDEYARLLEQATR